MNTQKLSYLLSLSIFRIASEYIMSIISLVSHQNQLNLEQFNILSQFSWELDLAPSECRDDRFPIRQAESLVAVPVLQNYITSVGYEESPVSLGLTTSQRSPISLGLTPLVLRDSTSMDPHSQCQYPWNGIDTLKIGVIG